MKRDLKKEFDKKFSDIKSSFKEYVKDKKMLRKYGQSYTLYKYSLDLIREYQKYADEVYRAEKFGGHKHFKTKEIEDEILRLIEEDETILYIQDEHGYTMPMDAVIAGLENVAIRALDNDKASRILNENLNNLGMVCADNNSERATLKALDNKKACLQVNDMGDNMGILAAKSGFLNATLKALENREAVKQRAKEWDKYPVSWSYYITTYCKECQKLSESDQKYVGKLINNYGLYTIYYHAVIEGLGEPMIEKLREMESKGQFILEPEDKSTNNHSFKEEMVNSVKDLDIDFKEEESIVKETLDSIN